MCVCVCVCACIHVPATKHYLTAACQHMSHLIVFAGKFIKSQTQATSTYLVYVPAHMTQWSHAQRLGHPLAGAASVSSLPPNHIPGEGRPCPTCTAHRYLNKEGRSCQVEDIYIFSTHVSFVGRLPLFSLSYCRIGNFQSKIILPMRQKLLWLKFNFMYENHYLTVPCREVASIQSTPSTVVEYLTYLQLQLSDSHDKLYM